MSTHTVTLIGGLPIPHGLFGGHWQLSGTTVEKDQMPISRTVELYVETSPQMRGGNIGPVKRTRIASQRSGSDGTWLFQRLSGEYRYTVIAYDHTGQYDPVIKAGLIPTPMDD